MKEINLEEKLIEYSQSDFYPFHMPGHKRQKINNVLPYELDITEIDGFDDLHHADGILKEAQKRAAQLYGAKRSFYLINGSTCGLLTAVFATVKEGEHLLIARNCHKSVYHGALIRKACLSYLYPSMTSDGLNGSIIPADLEAKLKENPEIKAVVITSPTYEGIVSNIEELAAVAHRYGAALIVDEAHGAHFGLAENFPRSAVALGADLVIQSMHKMLPAMTQTALLHCNGDSDLVERVKFYLKIFQTSSPSYVLMASMDACVTYLNEHGTQQMQKYQSKLEHVKKLLEVEKQSNKIRLLSKLERDKDSIYQLDPSKLVFITADTALSGREFYDLLRVKYHLQLEMASGNYAIAMTSMLDTTEGFRRLADAVKEINASMASTKDDKNHRSDLSITEKRPKKIIELYEAENKETEKLPLLNCSERVSAEFIYAYPPGIPIIVPGEEITDEIITEILKMKNQGLSIQGMQDESADYLLVIKKMSES